MISCVSLLQALLCLFATHTASVLDHPSTVLNFRLSHIRSQLVLLCSLESPSQVPSFRVVICSSYVLTLSSCFSSPNQLCYCYKPLNATKASKSLCCFITNYILTFPYLLGFVIPWIHVFFIHVISMDTYFMCQNSSVVFTVNHNAHCVSGVRHYSSIHFNLRFPTDIYIFLILCCCS